MQEKDWKEEQKNTARYAYVRLVNKTGQTLFRQLSDIVWGAWSFFPPERIAPNAVAEFGSHSNIFVTGTEALVTYKTAGGASFLVRWAHPFFTNPWHQIQTSKAFKINATDKRKKINMKNFGCDFEFTVNINKDNNTNNLVIDDPQLQLLKKAQEETKKLEEISELQRNISNSKRSVFIMLKNNTKTTFIRSQHTLFVGDWLCEPPQEFPPQSTIEFGSKNKEPMSGTSGVVQYGHSNSNSDIKISWDNPFFEKSIFNKNCPLEFTIETRKSINRNHAELIYVINDKVSDEKEDIQDSKDNLIETLKFKIFSYNTHLMPPGQTVIDDPITRAKLIADSIVRPIPSDDTDNCKGNFDIVCLQDVYYNACKEILEQTLKGDYPHIATRFGKYNSGTDLDSGLFIASKYKIEKIDFHRFENGIGSDAEKDKGVLVAKLDTATVRDNSFVYILNTNLQCNPDSSLGWKAVQNKKQSAKKVREAQFHFIKKIIDNIVSEEKGKMKSNSIILCGTFNVNAEKIIADTRTEWMENNLIPQLAQKLSDENFSVSYAQELSKMLEAEGLSEHMIGRLRSKVTSNRSRALLLIIIINSIIKEKIWNEFSQEYNNSDTEEQKGKLYLSVCLKYLNAITVDEDVEEKYKLPSDPFWKKKLPTTNNTSAKSTKLIWTDDLAERIEEKYPGSLSHDEKTNYLFLKFQVIPFQQFKHLSDLLLLSWSPQIELEVLEGNKMLVDNDIFDVNLKSLFTQYAKAKKLTKSESVDLQITSEYDSMMEILGSPVDIFRDLNPNIVGTTSECHHLAIKKPKRVDYIFQYKKIKRDDNEKKESVPINPLLGNVKGSPQGDLFVFRTLKCETWALHTFNSSVDLSNHQALSVLCYPFGTTNK